MALAGPRSPLRPPFQPPVRPGRLPSCSVAVVARGRRSARPPTNPRPLSVAGPLDPVSPLAPPGVPPTQPTTTSLLLPRRRPGAVVVARPVSAWLPHRPPAHQPPGSSKPRVAAVVVARPGVPVERAPQARLDRAAPPSVATRARRVQAALPTASAVAVPPRPPVDLPELAEPPPRLGPVQRVVLVVPGRQPFHRLAVAVAVVVPSVAVVAVVRTTAPMPPVVVVVVVRQPSTRPVRPGLPMPPASPVGPAVQLARMDPSHRSPGTWTISRSSRRPTSPTCQVHLSPP